MSKSLITLLNESSRAVATIASVVTLTFVMLILAPTVAAAQDAADEAANEALIAGSEERQLSTAIAKVKRTLEKLQSKLDKNEDGTLEKNELKQLENSVRQLDHTVTQRFDQIGQHIQANNLDPVIEQRQADMVATYRTEFDALVANLANLDSSDAAVVAQAVADALAQLNQFTLERPHQPVVPGQFSNFSVEPDFENKPKETETDFTRAGYFDNPYLQLAALGDFTFDRLPGADNPAYLAETDEVRITDAVRAKAAELDNDPVKIYYWVRNNVEWLPTWGAIQDADITLGSLRGNAIDISSLLIALYRASGIPARYVHGAIEVPVDQFNNWAGNFTDTQAALSFASSGGIPLQLHTLTIGETTTTTVHMEHIWVEAALDYFPSRAAVNKDADSWMKLDASFKQYEKEQGLDAIEISGLDTNQVAQDLIDSGTINETEGWVQGFDTSIMQTALTQVQTSLGSYVENQLSNPTVSDVIGGRRTIIEEYPAIPSNMETNVLATGARYSQIPDQLAPKISFAFSTDILGYPNDPITFRWSKLNNRKVTLSFRPASQADEDALDSLIPLDADGPEDVPDSIPSYLVRVIPELKIEGNLVKTGGALTLGDELLLYNEIVEPNRPVYRDQRSIIVGSSLSFAVIGGSVSQLRLEQIQSDIEFTEEITSATDDELMDQLGDDALTGDLYYAGLLAYFSHYLTQASFIAESRAGKFGLPLSAGVFGYEPNVSYFFGLPRAISLGGVAMDLHRVARVVIAPEANYSENIVLNTQIGALSSALEHSIPEEMFSPEDNHIDGISAVKALSLANAMGQKIYTINASNIAQNLANISASIEVKNEISAYVNAGFEATIHENPISVNGWAGSGYVLQDNNTGSASWKITGGQNGAFLAVPLMRLQFAVGVWLSFAKKNPVIAKALTGSLGLILGTLTRLVKLLQTCSIGIALIGVMITIGWNILVLSINVALVASGVGILAIGLLSGLEYYLEQLAVEAFIDSACS